MDQNDELLMPRQLTLLDATDDAAVLFPREQLEKCYTAGQVKEIERLRKAVCMLLLAGFPKEEIAKRLGMSTRTIEAVGMEMMNEVAGSKTVLVSSLRRTAAAALGLIRMRLSEATVAQLAVVVGVTLDKARDLELTGLGGEEKVLTEERDKAAAILELTALRDRLLGVGKTTDLPSNGGTLNSNDLHKIDSGCGGIDAGDKGAVPGTGPEGTGTGDQGREAGGGSRPPPESE